MSDEGTTPEYVIVRSSGDNACSGPNHGNPHAQPKGTRRWFAGQCLSITQTFDEGATHNVFCGPMCLCDWHGTIDALLQGTAEDKDPPGHFTLAWISTASTSVGIYLSWEELTKTIGNYQKTLIEKGLI